MSTGHRNIIIVAVVLSVLSMIGSLTDGTPAGMSIFAALVFFFFVYGVGWAVLSAIRALRRHSPRPGGNQTDAT